MSGKYTSDIGKELPQPFIQLGMPLFQEFIILDIFSPIEIFLLFSDNSDFLKLHNFKSFVTSRVLRFIQRHT